MNYFAIGFGAVALTAVGAIDYANQARAAGHAPGTFTASAYFATYAGRIDGVRDARAGAAEDKVRAARRSTGARPYLPPPPDGWTRRAWTDGDNSAIIIQQPGSVPAGAAQSLKNFAAMGEGATEKRRNDETWVYQRGADIVAIRAGYTEREGARNLAAATRDTLAAVGQQHGWGVIGGVAYGVHPADISDPDAPHISQAGTPVVSLGAHFGFHDEIALSVQSNADTRTTRALLATIDYDGLNALLTYPLPHVGADAPDVPPEFEAQFASLMLKLRQDLLLRRTAQAQAWMARASSPENAMKIVLNEVMTGWGVGGVANVEMTAPPGAQARGDTPAEFGSSVTSWFGAAPPETPEATPAAPPKRLQLSGGTSCLEGSAGRFCRD